MSVGDNSPSFQPHSPRQPTHNGHGASPGLRLPHHAPRARSSSADGHHSTASVEFSDSYRQPNTIGIDYSRDRYPSGPHATARGSLRSRGRDKSSRCRLFSCDDGQNEVETAPVPEDPATISPGTDQTEVLHDENNDDADSMATEDSFTLRDKQNAINSSHPFGIRIWKPALYKKIRSVELSAEEDLRGHHRAVTWSTRVGNFIWCATFGLVLFLLCTFSATIMVLAAGWYNRTVLRYATLIYHVGWFLLQPFGKVVELMFKDAYRNEDEGIGGSVADYLEWRTSPSQGRPIFAPGRRRESEVQHGRRRRLFGRGSWTLGRLAFFIWFYLILCPVLTVMALICWFGIFTVPMTRLIFTLIHHLRVHPLALKFSSERHLNSDASGHDTSIVLCAYRAFGCKYYKYTLYGTNIILLNMLAVVVFTIGDYYTLQRMPESAQFALSLVSIIPLAYFIGQAVASISAQSSMSMGATVNAFFSTVVEVFLYFTALSQGKGELVEGSIIGSFMAGVVLLPGLSMCAGALVRKTQRFNHSSTGVTTTMLYFAIGGALTPTIWYRIYGPDTVKCLSSCSSPAAEVMDSITQTCQCWISKVPLSKDHAMYANYVRPLTVICAISLFIAYIAGLFFTLRTHAAMIWASAVDEEEAAHDAPNWGRANSYVILLTSTWLYAIIAEILVDSVDIVLQHVNVSQRVLGITIFALVPNTTEFMNAISFAMYGNVSLSLEIGSAYALQVCLLQIPALVLASLRHLDKASSPLRDHVYTMQFSDWDIWTAIICVFLYSNVHLEGKSNYFKGIVLILAYVFLVAGYVYSMEQAVEQVDHPINPIYGGGASVVGFIQQRLVQLQP